MMSCLQIRQPFQAAAAAATTTTMENSRYLIPGALKRNFISPNSGDLVDTHPRPVIISTMYIYRALNAQQWLPDK